MATHRAGTVWTFLLILAVMAGGVATPGHAQGQDGIPEIPNAELLFEEGVAAFERGEYRTAYDRFRLVSEYELNRKTTAALLMGGKALVELGRYQDALDRLNVLLGQYPQTTYRDQAESLLEQVKRRSRRLGQAADTLRIGVTLPMGDTQVSMSQALFNGVRLAVDEHNGLRRRYVRPSGLQASTDSFEVYDTGAVHGDSLAEANGRTTVAASRPAGKRAEEARVLLVAPMATDESVSAGRDYVFQANPTIPDRGRIMARVAKNGLLINRVGVIYERGNSLSARMAEGFRREAQRQDLEVPLTIPLEGGRDWSRLSTLIEEDSTLTDSLLAAPEAYYLPVSGRGAAGKIQGVLTGVAAPSPPATCRRR